MKLGVFVLLLIAFNSLASQKTPSKIVSLSLASDEILLEVLTRCQKTSSLLALSNLADDQQYSNISEASKVIKQRAGSSLEHLLKMNPDLVFAATFNRKELLDGLKKSKIQVVLLKNFESIDDVSENIILVAKASGCEKAGQELLRSFQQKLTMVEKLKRPVRLIEFSKSGRIMAGKTTFDAIVKVVNAKNIASDELKLSYWPLINIEQIITSNPDVIVTFSEDERTAVQKTVGWKDLNAVKTNHVITLNPASAQALSQYLVNAAVELSEKLRKLP